ncbi:MAG TPA: CoA-transferase [Acidimicrobiia bacterium]|nr:CoA-transferase [Acidimicrobiia bacterium]
MKLIGAADAVGLVGDGTTLIIGGSGGGHAVPQLFIDSLAARFSQTGGPRDLTTVRVVGIGDFGERGFSQLALPGLMKRTIGSNLGNEPALADLIAGGELEAYSFPQGVLSQLCREIAAGRPGLFTKIGLGTYVDPRQTGGKQGIASEDLVEVHEIGGEEWLFFKSFPIDVAVIRGSVIDEDGNLSMEDEAVRGEMLAMAMAAHNSGGIVISQAKTLAPRHSLVPRRVEVPGALIDYAYLDPAQTQTYVTDASPYYSGQDRMEPTPTQPEPVDIRKVIARRSLTEFGPGDICNLGFGISQSIGRIAWEEGIADRLVLTVEQGVFGGVPASGNDGGAGFNFQALIEQPAMMSFYDGGGLDIASLSFAEVDRHGNVNVHKFGDRLRGPGGFQNIATATPRVCFVGTFTAGGEVGVVDGRLEIEREGGVRKFVDEVTEITFSGEQARLREQEVLYITERAVFRLGDEGLDLIEVADGVDVERDILAHMDFHPVIAEPLGRMDPALFRNEPLGLSERFGADV